MIFRLLLYLMVIALYSPPAFTASKSITNMDSGSPEAGVLIEIRESVHVNNRKITLGEIAHIEAPEMVKRQLSAIDMGFAPAPGKNRIIDGRQIESRIRSSRILAVKGADQKNMRPSNGLNSPDRLSSHEAPKDLLTLLVPEKVYIERASQEVSEHDLKALYESYIGEHLDSMDFEIRNFNARGLDTYPEGEVQFSEPSSNSGEIKGRVTLYVKISVDGKDYGRISLSGWVDIFDNVLCASHQLAKGRIIEAGDVHSERLNIAGIHGDYFSSDQDVIGKVLVRGATANKAITPNMIEDAALVRKGDRVKIVAARGNLSIVTIGVVKNNGKVDDTVQVQNLTSGKVINAVVTGKESVKVFY